MRLAFILCLLPLLSWSQPIQRQFWTTNTNPREVIAQGTNVFITFSTPSPDVRQYLIDVPSMVGQTNNTVLSAGTNVVIVTNVSGAVTVYTVSAVPGVQTNVTLLAAGTNVFVSSATNNGVITYTIDVPTNAFPTQQTNWPWQSITNIASVQLPYSSITNPPSDIERTNWAITDITNSLNLTNWALLSTNTFTNVIVSAGSNVFVTPSVSGQLRTYTVDVPASSSGTVYASNVVSGGILPIGTVASNSPFPGSFLEGTTGTRYWSQDGSTLTNLTGTNINGNLNVILLGTITNQINSPAVTAGQFTNAAGLPNALAVYGANTNLIGLANGAYGASTFINSSTTPAWFTPASLIFYREEMDNTGLPPGWTGTGSIGITTGTALHPGIVALTTGSSSSAANGMWRSGTAFSSYLFGNGLFYFEWVVNLSILSTNSSDGYLARAGITDIYNSSSTAIPNNCVMFQYSDGTNSGKWQAVLRKATGTIYVADTGLTAASNTWTVLSCAISADASSTTFYTNRVSAAVINQGAPIAAGSEVQPSIGILKFVGTNARLFYADLYWHAYQLTTPR